MGGAFAACCCWSGSAAVFHALFVFIVLSGFWMLSANSGPQVTVLNGG